MKKKNTVPLHIPVLWFITTALWTIRLCVNVHNGKEPSILDIAVVCLSLAAAVTNLVRYVKEKKAQGE